MTDDRARLSRSAGDEFEKERHQRIITARLVAVVLVLAAQLAIELDRRPRPGSGQTTLWSHAYPALPTGSAK